MKLKYYLRGFGTGVIFATIILMIAFEISNSFTSNGNSASSGNLQTSETVNEAESSGEEQTTDSNLNTEDDTSMTLQNDTTTSDELETESETESVTEPEIGTTVNNTDAGTVTFVITSGMISNRAAELLEELGVVEDGYDFNMYLYNNGYESKLRVGTYEIAKGASYEEIARIITGR